jgi:hypothetical protein
LKHAALLWLLTILFSLRVAGQAIQRWAPQSWLPPFDAFQGSSLPYGVLLASQLVILAAMAWFAFHIPKPRRLLLWAGGVYMAGSLARIAVGLLVPNAPAWFSTWIPASFHVVLAAYLLTLAHHHRYNARGLT